jgi:hypothetical protein
MFLLHLYQIIYKMADKLTEIEKQDLEDRVKACKDQLPGKPLAWFLRKFPEYNKLEGINKVKRVLALRAHDEEITTKLESFTNYFNIKNN